MRKYTAGNIPMQLIEHCNLKYTNVSALCCLSLNTFLTLEPTELLEI